MRINHYGTAVELQLNMSDDQMIILKSCGNGGKMPKAFLLGWCFMTYSTAPPDIVV